MFKRLDLKVFLTILLSFFLMVNLHAEQQKGKVIFLRNGELWAYDSGTKKEKQLTETKHNIRRFLLSPKGDYVALERCVGKMYDQSCEPEDDTDKIKKIDSIQVEVASIQDLSKTIKIFNREDELYSYHCWTQNGELLISASNGPECTAQYWFNPKSTSFIKDTSDLFPSLRGCCFDSSKVKNGEKTF